MLSTGCHTVLLNLFYCFNRINGHPGNYARIAGHRLEEVRGLSFHWSSDCVVLTCVLCAYHSATPAVVWQTFSSRWPSSWCWNRLSTTLLNSSARKCSFPTPLVWAFSEKNRVGFLCVNLLQLAEELLEKKGHEEVEEEVWSLLPVFLPWWKWLCWAVWCVQNSRVAEKLPAGWFRLFQSVQWVPGDG